MIPTFFDREQRTDPRLGVVGSLGGVSGDYPRNQIWSVGGQLAAAYLNVRNPNFSFFGNSTSGTPSATTSNVTSVIYSGYGSAHTYQVAAAGGA